MKKILCLALAFVLSAGILSGCRGNVSDHRNGKITEPTGTMATMPGTETAPIATTDPMNTTEPMTTTPSTGTNRG